MGWQLCSFAQQEVLPSLNESASINGWQQRQISIDSFLNHEDFIVVERDTSIRLISCQLVIDAKDTNALVARINSSELNRFKDRLKALQPGDALIVDAIKGSSSQGTVQLAPVIYRLTE